MKNEWDMFAAVRKELQAGAAVVNIYLTSPVSESSAAHLGQALDEAGESYELGSEFIAAFQECIRKDKIAWSYSPASRRWGFGPGLEKESERPSLPGALSIDLRNVEIELLFGSEEKGYNSHP